MKSIFLSLIITLMLLCSQEAGAQSAAPVNTRSYGLAVLLQENQFDIMMPIWLSRSFSLAPSAGLLWTESAGTDLRIGIVPRFYNFHKDNFASYFGGRVGAFIAMPESGNNIIDILAGLSFGGEYFLDQHFSLGAEAQLNLIISDDNSLRFSNPGKKAINTGAAVFATVYF